MKIFVSCLLLLLLFGCLLKKTIEEEKTETRKAPQITEITIELAQSGKYDFKNETYTVYFMEKDPVVVKFSLSNEEKEEIFKKCQSLELSSDAKEIIFDGYCPNMPTLYTTILTRSAESSQSIKISAGCDYSHTTDRDQVTRVTEFLQLVSKLISSKPEVKAAPESDILYC